MNIRQKYLTEKNNWNRIAFQVFSLFALTRPISLIDLNIPYFLDLYALAFSYTFLFFVAISFRKIVVNRTVALIFTFILYCSCSLTWGTDFRELAKFILPLTFFFFSIIYIDNIKQIENFYIVYVVGFFLPLILSVVFVILGINIQLIEFLSKVPRHSGIYSGAHVLAYQMFTFSFFFCYIYLLSNPNNKLYKFLLIIMLILSIFCLYKSYTRTAYIGFVLFWGLFFFGTNKKLFIGLAFTSIIIMLVFSSQITNIFIKSEGSVDINVATSGRTELWDNYFNSFLDSSVPEKIIGKGIGWKLQGPGFHNDWLRLLLQTGIVGLAIYISILISILYDIYICKFRNIKFYFGSILISFSIISFGSNVVISFFELSILFWIFMGFFYKLNSLFSQE